MRIRRQRPSLERISGRRESPVRCPNSTVKEHAIYKESDLVSPDETLEVSVSITESSNVEIDESHGKLGLAIKSNAKCPYLEVRYVCLVTFAFW